MIPAAVVGMLPRRPRQAIARASVSALVASLPVLYVSLLRPPPAALAGDTAFWFLVSNCVIAAIVATSDDAGTLLFKSAADDDDPGGGGGCLSCVPAAQPTPVAVQGIGGDAVAPLAAPTPQDDGPPGVDVDMNGGRVQGEVASPVASGYYAVHHALPSLMEGEEGAASEPSAEINDPVQRGEEEEEGVILPSTVKNNTIKVEAHGREDSEVSPLATIDEGSALADPEPEPRSSSRVLASTKSLPEEEALCYRPPEAPAQGVAAAREGDLRRSATVGRKPAAEESEYWQLSDEELNRRVEDFIARFNRDMRLQIEQEAGV